MGKNLPSLYWGLCFVRIVLVFVPQVGYIHPDEFFQSIEVQAGDVFNVEVNMPWEFNATFPVRSVIIPYFTIGLVYRLGSIFDQVLASFSGRIITPYFLVVAPRLLMCILSFLVDYSIFRVSTTNNEKYKSKLIVLASSYVILVYGTRTFSNTVELILFALLLYYVCESVIFSNILTKKREYLKYRYECSKNVSERAKFHKLKLFLISDTFRHCGQISTLTVFGFFNRPTFLAFALFPLFFWFYRGVGSKSSTPLNFHLRILVFILYAVPSVIFHVLIDSFYFGHLTWGEVGMLKVSINNFVFVPFNFIKYNLDVNNLAKHGLHPRLLHVLVNMPLLFNLLAIFGFYATFAAILNLSRGKITLLPTVRSIKGLMMVSYLAPLAMLSVFQHQEPRFLIPIIIPLVYLYSDSILPDPDNFLVKLEARAPIKFLKVDHSNVFFKLWLFINVILLIFFGFVHQGGVYKAVKFLSTELSVSPRTDYYIITSHIYSLPRSLVLERVKKRPLRRTLFLEEGSKDLDYVIKDLVKLTSRVNSRRSEILLIIPSSLDHDLDLVCNSQNLNIKRISRFFPHISTEAFPHLDTDFSNFYSKLSSRFVTNCLGKFGLDIYTVIF